MLSTVRVSITRELFKQKFFLVKYIITLFDFHFFIRFRANVLMVLKISYHYLLIFHYGKMDISPTNIE